MWHVFLSLVVLCLVAQVASGQELPKASRTVVAADAKYSCSQQKEPELRLQPCTQVIQGDPLAAWAYNERAWAYLKMGKAAQGLPDVEKSLELNPNNGMALDTRGHIFEALGRREEAVADFRRALSVSGGNLALRNSSRAGLERLGVSAPPDTASDGIPTGASRPSQITQSPENHEFGRGVIRAMKGTMPKSSTIGRITIKLLLDEKGKLQEIRTVKMEGDAQMERMVLDAARRTRFPMPPKDSTIIDRTFVVNYVYR